MLSLALGLPLQLEWFPTVRFYTSCSKKPGRLMVRMEICKTLSCIWAGNKTQIQPEASDGIIYILICSPKCELLQSKNPWQESAWKLQEIVTTVGAEICADEMGGGGNVFWQMCVDSAWTAGALWDLPSMRQGWEMGRVTPPSWKGGH